MRSGNRIFFKVLAAAVLLAVHAMADGKINKISVGGDTIDLTINTTVGERYQVQCRNDLMSGDWVAVGNSFLAVETSSIRTVDASLPACYFRVVKEDVDAIGSPLPPPPPPPPPED